MVVKVELLRSKEAIENRFVNQWGEKQFKILLEILVDMERTRVMIKESKDIICASYSHKLLTNSSKSHAKVSIKIKISQIGK